MKDAHSHYLPGKRKWLKMKRDYLGDGSMADTADLVRRARWVLSYRGGNESCGGTVECVQ